jgi:hypothetical protein
VGNGSRQQQQQKVGDARRGTRSADEQAIEQCRNTLSALTLMSMLDGKKRKRSSNSPFIATYRLAPFQSTALHIDVFYYAKSRIPQLLSFPASHQRTIRLL